MNFDKYKNTLPVPWQGQYNTHNYYSRGVLVAKKIGDDGALQFINGNSIDGTTHERQRDEVAYRAARQAHQAETTRLQEEFFDDVKADLGIENNPKADKLLAKAWERGHSAGYSEVYNEACDLVDLIQEEFE